MLKVLISRLTNADRSRRNALLAARCLHDARREREEVDAYLASMHPVETADPGAA